MYCFAILKHHNTKPASRRLWYSLPSADATIRLMPLHVRIQNRPLNPLILNSQAIGAFPSMIEIGRKLHAHSVLGLMAKV
jgi:hypothetical protein